MEYRMFKNLLLAEHKKFKKDIAKALEACERNLDSIRKNNNNNRDKRKKEKLEKEIKLLNNKDFVTAT